MSTASEKVTVSSVEPSFVTALTITAAALSVAVTPAVTASLLPKLLKANVPFCDS